MVRTMGWVVLGLVCRVKYRLPSRHTGDKTRVGITWLQLWLYYKPWASIQGLRYVTCRFTPKTLDKNTRLAAK